MPGHQPQLPQEDRELRLAAALAASRAGCLWRPAELASILAATHASVRAAKPAAKLASDLSAALASNRATPLASDQSAALAPNRATALASDQPATHASDRAAKPAAKLAFLLAAEPATACVAIRLSKRTARSREG